MCRMHSPGYVVYMWLCLVEWLVVSRVMVMVRVRITVYLVSGWVVVMHT